MSIDPTKKIVRDGMEKYLLRKSFEKECLEKLFGEGRWIFRWCIKKRKLGMKS